MTELSLTVNSFDRGEMHVTMSPALLTSERIYDDTCH